MASDPNLLLWLRMAQSQFDDMVTRMEKGEMRLQVRSGEGWVDVTDTRKPDLRELMWRMEALAAKYEKKPNA